MATRRPKTDITVTAQERAIVGTFYAVHRTAEGVVSLLRKNLAPR